MGRFFRLTGQRVGTVVDNTWGVLRCKLFPVRGAVKLTLNPHPQDRRVRHLARRPAVRSLPKHGLRTLRDSSSPLEKSRAPPHGNERLYELVEVTEGLRWMFDAEVLVKT